MASRQERRAAERDAKRSARVREPTVNWISEAVDETIHVTPSVRMMNVPREVPNCGGHKLKVVRAFMTTPKCPYGAGLTCFVLEGNVRALEIKPGKLKWLVS